MPLMSISFLCTNDSLKNNASNLRHFKSEEMQGWTFHIIVILQNRFPIQTRMTEFLQYYNLILCRVE